MKKIGFLLAIAFAFCLSEVKAQTWPFGAGTNMTSLTAAGGTVVVNITNQFTYMGTVPTLTANATLSLTASSYVKAGAILLVNVKTNGTETTALTGLLSAPTVTGVAGKTWTQGFIYNGSKFYPMGAKIQVD